ncbi:MAG: PLP-dependent lyase/thiolase [Candidatus Micrarchaeota archaeon]
MPTFKYARASGGIGGDCTELKCIKCNTTYPYEINRHNCPKCNDIKFSNLFVVGGHKNGGGPELPYGKKFVKNLPSGSTPLRKSAALSSAYGIRNLLVKDESYNPYGTHKDRRSEMIVNIALEQDVDKIVCLTAGNSGYSLSRYCYAAGIDYTSFFFPDTASETRRRSLREWGKAVELQVDEEDWRGILKYRDFAQVAKEYDLWERGKSWNKVWNVTNTFEPASLAAYKALAYEIAESKPDRIVLPVGTADLLVGVWMGLRELELNTQIVGAVPKDGNAFVPAFKARNDELILDSYDGSSKAEKLISPYCAMLPFTNRMLKDGHSLLEFTNDDLEAAKKNAAEAGLKCEYSALAAFAILPQLDVKEHERVVVVSTGLGLTN